MAAAAAAMRATAAGLPSLSQPARAAQAPQPLRSSVSAVGLANSCRRAGNLRSCRRSSLTRKASSAASARTVMVATPIRPEESLNGASPFEEEPFDASKAPPFTLADIRNAIPKHCWEKKTWKSMSYVFRDAAIVFGLAAAAAAVDNWLVWPLYWIAQGTMFWALFVVGHDCGHGSFSNNKVLNDLIGHLTHASILVPYHGWRISHRTHHANHGHVENDESWHPMSKDVYDELDFWGKTGRLSLPWSMFVYPFYLWNRSPGKKGSHFDPDCDLFTASERGDVLTSAAWWWGMIAVLVACTFALGPLAVFKLYVVPYWINVVWLDLTYLHHHGYEAKVPWYRGEEWSYLRGGLSTIDRDYGIFNNIHHDIGTHVVHHLFPQIPHYNLIEATEAVKPVMGKYYREPEPSPGPIPLHLFSALAFDNDHYVASEGDVVFYQRDPTLRSPKPSDS